MARYILKIDGMPDERTYNALPFGRQIEFNQSINDFKARAKTIHFSCKRTSTATGFKAFRKLYRPVQWFAVNRDSHMYHDDSFQVWFIAEPVSSEGK